jgi:hypothetical protein
MCDLEWDMRHGPADRGMAVAAVAMAADRADGCWAGTS